MCSYLCMHALLHKSTTHITYLHQRSYSETIVSEAEEKMFPKWCCNLACSTSLIKCKHSYIITSV